VLLVYFFEPYSWHRIESLRVSGISGTPVNGWQRRHNHAKPSKPEHHDSPDLLLAARQMLTKAVESIAEAHARLAAQLGLLSASTATGARINMADVRPQQKTTAKSLTCGNYL